MQIRAQGWSLAFTVSQIVGVALVAGFLLSCWSTLMHNLGRLDIQLDLRFMHLESGFRVTQSWLLHHRDDSNLHVLMTGFVNTLMVSGMAMVVTMLVAVLVVFFQQSQVLVLRWLARFYVSVFRNVPLLVQILVWYNVWVLKCPDVQNTKVFAGVMLNNRGVFLPAMQLNGFQWGWVAGAVLVMAFLLRLGQWKYVGRHKIKCFSLWPRYMVLAVVAYFLLLAFASYQGQVSWPKMGRFNVQGWQVFPEFLSLLLGLGLYTAAYQAETIRGAMMSVAQGQSEASCMVGLTRWQTLRYVILPQSLPAMLPSTGNHLMNLTKNSSLGVAVGYPEIFAVFAGTVLNQTGRAVEIMGIVMLVYLLLSMFILMVVNAINQRQSQWKGGCQK
jgi:general L-amino acid transport system permease protein